MERRWLVQNRRRGHHRRRWNREAGGPREGSGEVRWRVDQFRGLGKCAHGASRGERGMRGGNSTSQMAGAAVGGGSAKRWKERDRRRATNFLGGDICEMAVAGRVCVFGCDTAHQRWKIQEDGIARTVCTVEVGE